jgi:hypothetical protein
MKVQWQVIGRKPLEPRRHLRDLQFRTSHPNTPTAHSTLASRRFKSNLLAHGPTINWRRLKKATGRGSARGYRQSVSRRRAAQAAPASLEIQPDQMRPKNFLLKPQPRNARLLIKLTQRHRSPSPFLPRQFERFGHARFRPRSALIVQTPSPYRPSVNWAARKNRKGRGSATLKKPERHARPHLFRPCRGEPLFF